MATEPRRSCRVALSPTAMQGKPPIVSVLVTTLRHNLPQLVPKTYKCRAWLAKRPLAWQNKQDGWQHAY